MVNKFYVYTHSVDGIVFYVGKGTATRYKSKSFRNKIWHNIVEYYGFDNIEFNILYKDLDELTAETLEKNTILYPPADNYILCNQQLNHTKKSIDLDLLHKKLAYSEESPCGLIRKISAGNQAAGSYPGCVNKTNKYWVVRLGKGGSFFAHRLVWALHYGDIPDNLTIDHIDGNRLNNKISNLRICTMEENNRFKEERDPLRACNTSGIPGISEHSNGRNSLYARVQYTIDGKRYRKDFPYLSLGKEGAWDAAKSFKLSITK